MVALEVLAGTGSDKTGRCMATSREKANMSILHLASNCKPHDATSVRGA